jgi:superfamily I DNA and/or RNA helicase
MAQGFKGLTTDQPGAAAGTLTAQYRMHPAIGNLVSETFYGGLLSNETSVEEMDHKFQEPYSIDGKALVWLNTPWCKNAPAFAEHGDPKYTNEKEIEEIKLFLERLRFRERPPKVRYVAVLSPYNQQVRKLNAVLTDVTLPAGLEFRESLRARRAQEGPRRAHTVDSFQGNQADVVIISLVRNNTHRPWSGGPRGDEPDPLGFLSDEKRLNVLVSRAERLLVLVGSWDFFTEQLIGLSSEAEATTPLLKWKVMMNHFQSKNAVIVPYRGLSGGGRK